MANDVTIKWLKKALENLDREATYIAQDNPLAAQAIVIKIMEATQLLTRSPSLGKPGRITGTRELVVPDTYYIIPYRIKSKENRIEILRVFHTSRKQPDKW